MTSVVLNTVRAFDIKKLGFDPWPVVAGWVVSAVVAVAVPWAHWNRKRQQYYKYAGYLVEYQNQQREYNEGQNGQQYYGNNCSWWQWGCSNNQYGNNNYQQQQQNQQQYQNGNYNQQYNQNGMRFPSWFLRLGGTTEENRRQREEMMGNSTPSAVRVIHAWTNILFVGLVLYGAVSLARGTNLNSVRTAFFIFLQAAIMMMILIPQGAISTEDREMEDSVYGWYGQLGVLMVYQDFWYALFSVFACIFLTARMIFVQRQARAVTTTSANYKTMAESDGTTDIA